MLASTTMTMTAIADLRTLQESIRACTRCPALVRCRSRVVPGAGAAPGMVAFVGIAPGRLGGDRTGLPFSGDRSGTILRAMLARTGLRRVFITNLVRCNPRDARGRNRDPSPREVANCRKFLEAELALVRPRVIVCLGRMAWSQMAGRASNFAAGETELRAGGAALLYAMYHPAYVARGAYPMERYARDFAGLRELLGSPGFARCVRGSRHPLRSVL